MDVIKWILIAVLLGIFIPNGSPTHFRGAIIMMRPTDSDYEREMEISFQVAWRRDYSQHFRKCDERRIQSEQLMGKFSNGEFICLEGCPHTQMGITNEFYCTDFSVTDDWTFGGRQINFNFTESSDHATVVFKGYDWIAPFKNDWYIPTKNNLSTRNDTGKINSTPRAITAPFVKLQEHCNHTIYIPVNDPDWDIVSCRWGNGTEECGEVCNEFPYAILDSSTCTITYESIHGTGIKIAALMIEDFLPGSSMPLSSVAYQFIIEIYSSNQSCSTQPHFIPPTIPPKACLAIPNNFNFSTQLMANSGQIGVDVKEIVTVSPAGFIKSSLTPTDIDEISYVDIFWQPTEVQQDQINSFCFIAINSIYQSSEQRCIRLMVGSSPPSVIFTSLTLDSYGYYEFRMKFDRHISKPNNEAKIRFHHYENSSLLYEVNTSSSEIDFLSNQNITIKPNFVFPEKQKIYIELTRGVVVGINGCNPGNEPVMDKDFWNFITVDITPPRITFINPPMKTNKDVIFQWTSNEPTRTTCSLDFKEITDCSTGRFSARNLTEGWHILFLTSIDSANNTVNMTHKFFTDLTDPITSFKNLPNYISKEKELIFVFSCDEQTNDCTFYCDFHNLTTNISNYTKCSGNKFFTPPLENEEEYELSVYSVDSALNIGDATSFRWKVDLIPPEIIINDTKIQCQLETDPAKVRDNIDANPQLTFTDSNNSCVKIRTWKAIDEAGNIAEVKQKIVLSFSPSLSMLQYLSLPCYNTIENIPQNTASAPNPCNRPLVLSSADNYNVSVCPGQFVRSWSVHDECSGKEISAEQIITLYNTCPVYACGQNYSEPHGLCSEGKCLCNQPWYGNSCRTEYYKPIMKPIKRRKLLEYQDYEVELSLLQGTEPIEWNLINAPFGTRIERSSGRLIYENAQVGNQSFTVTAGNRVGIDEQTIYIFVYPTYSATLDPFTTNSVQVTDPITITGSVTHMAVSPIKDVLDNNVPVLIYIYSPSLAFTRTIEVLTDKYSKFSTIFYLGSLIYGKFEASATHPSKPKGIPQIYWEKAGMQSIPKLISLIGETNGKYHNSFLNVAVLTNDGPLDLHTIIAKISIRELEESGINVDVTFGVFMERMSSLASGDSVTVNIAIATPGFLRSRFHIDIISEEGISCLLTVDLDIKQISPVFDIKPSKIKSSVLRGSQKLINFDVTNVGRTNARNVMVALPNSQIFALYGLPISNGENEALTLGSAETQNFTLFLTIPADMSLGMISGSLYVNSDTAKAELPFSILITSNNHMDLTIIVEDEYTYFAKGNPLVSDAVITLVNKIRGIELNGSTILTKGSVTFNNIPEDRYEITIEAPDHKTLNEIIVTSQITPSITIFIDREAVSIKWSVTETEIRDTYDITLEANYKVNVPLPVLSITPNEINLEDYTSVLNNIIEFNITNHGLIRADDIEINLPGNHISLYFEFLNDVPSSLGEKESVIIPVQIKQSESQKQSSKCPHYGGTLVYTYVCNNKKFRSVPIFIKDKCRNCTENCVFPFSAGPIIKGSGSVHFEGFTSTSVDLCDLDFGCPLAVLGCLPINIKIPFSKMFIKKASKYSKGLLDYSEGGNIKACLLLIATGTDPFANIVNFLKYISCVGDKFDLPGWIFCLYDLIVECDIDILPSNTGTRKKRFIEREVLKDVLQERVENFAKSASGVLSSINILEEVFGDKLWLYKGNLSWVDKVLAPIFEDSSELGHLVSPKEIELIKEKKYPEGVLWEDINKLVHRFNTTLTNWPKGNMEPNQMDTNIMSYSLLEENIHKINMSNEISKKRGFSSYSEAYDFDYDKLTETEIDKEDGVCAIVKIQLKQTATLTRESFIASLEIENMKKRSMKDIHVEISIHEKETSMTSTKKFAIGKPKLRGSLNGIDGNGTLLQGSSGSSEWLIIPYSEAAPKSSIIYDIGGKLSYLSGDNKIEIPFLPSSITVEPDPSLMVHYFWEKYVISDDPFTDEIEPAVPFSLGVMIKNEGFGTAYSFKISSAQPEIIENEKGLLISFEIIKSSLGKEETSPSLTIDFGDILSNETKTARWWMTSSLMGKFINYTATFESKNPLGDPKLSLIDNLTIHELIQNVRIPGDSDDGILDFLVNDERDLYAYPDRLYNSIDMSSFPVMFGNITHFTHEADSEYFKSQINIEMQDSGWYYFTIQDPVLSSLPTGKSLKFMRQDNYPDGYTEIVLPNENAWILVDVTSKRREKTLNFIDYFEKEIVGSSSIAYLIDISKSGQHITTDGLTTDGKVLMANNYEVTTLPTETTTCSSSITNLNFLYIIAGLNFFLLFYVLHS